MSEAQPQGKKRDSDTIIIPEILNTTAIFIGGAVAVAGIGIGCSSLMGYFQKQLSVFGMLGLLLASLLLFLVGLLILIGSILSVVEKTHLALSSTHVKIRRGDKKIYCKISYRDIHSTKIDYYQAHPNTAAIRVLFIYLYDDPNRSIKWMNSWRPQDNILYLPNSWRKSLETIQDIIEGHREELSW